MSSFLQNVGNECLYQIKGASWFPFKTGKLKFNATSGTLLNETLYEIKFDGSIAPYIEYLEEGTAPHDIPFAFVGKGNFVWWYPYKDGVPFLMGMGGRFDGKFHPGSLKHKGFISNKSVQAIIQYIASKYGGIVK